MGPKSNYRFDYALLAEALGERGLVEATVLQSVLQQTKTTGALFPELLVNEKLVSDWELSRVACEVFGLAFIPVDNYEPSEAALKGIDPTFLDRYCLVPLDRHNDLLSVAMPGVTPSEVLGALAEHAQAHVLPVVGSVASNRRWLTKRLHPEAPAPKRSGARAPQPAAAAPNGQSPKQAAAQPEPEAPLPKAPALDLSAVEILESGTEGEMDAGEWMDFFDAAEAAVQNDLKQQEPPERRPPGSR